MLHNLHNIQSVFGIFPILSTECPEIEVAVIAHAGNFVITAAIILIAREGDLNAVAIMRLVFRVRRVPYLSTIKGRPKRLAHLPIRRVTVCNRKRTLRRIISIIIVQRVAADTVFDNNSVNI